MNSVVNLNSSVQFMSTKEISNLTGKLHKNVVRDVRQILDEIDGSFLSHEEYQELKDNRGYTSEFLLNKNLTLTLMTGYDVNTRHKINVRWQELEAQVVKSVDPMEALSDPNVLRGLLLGYSEKMVQLEQKVEVMQPTVDAFDRIATADGSLCLTDTAKALQMRPKDFISFLNQKQWIYKRTGSTHYVGYQEKVQAGYLEHKVTEVTRGDGSSKITEQVRVTPKGLTRLSKLLGNNHV